MANDDTITSELYQAKSEIERIEKMVNESRSLGLLSASDIFWCLKAILVWMEATERKLLSR
jgi:hypothetical protein